MASLTKHPKSPYWTACYTNRDGKQVKRSTKLKNRNKAMQMALELEGVESQARAGTATTIQLQKILNEVAQKVNGDTIIAPSVENYLSDWLKNKSARNSEGTIERYGHTCKIFQKYLGDKVGMPITALTASHIEGFLTWRLNNGAAPKTAIVDIKTLNTAFSRAEKHSLILKNPVQAVELPKNVSSVRQTFSHAQVKLLLNTAESYDWKTLILLGYCTGARLSDCVQMKWENVNWEEKVIYYCQKKTGKYVKVPIHIDLWQQLDFIREFFHEGFLCPSLADKGSGGKHGLSESFSRIVKKAGIDPLKTQGLGKQKFNALTFHSLRHSFNSNLANAGVSQEIRMKLTGHSSVAMNDRYTHHDIAPLQSAIRGVPSFETEE